MSKPSSGSRLKTLKRTLYCQIWGPLCQVNYLARVHKLRRKKLPGCTRDLPIAIIPSARGYEAFICLCHASAICSMALTWLLSKLNTHQLFHCVGLFFNALWSYCRSQEGARDSHSCQWYIIRLQVAKTLLSRQQLQYLTRYPQPSCYLFIACVQQVVWTPWEKQVAKKTLIKL